MADSVSYKFFISFCFILILCSFSVNGISQYKKMEFKFNIVGINSGNVEILIEPPADIKIIRLEKKVLEFKNGKVKLVGEIKYPCQLRIIVNDSILSNVFYLEPGLIAGQFILDSSGKLSHLINSNTNNEYLNNYRPLLKQLNATLDKWYENHFIQQNYFNHNIPSQIEDSMMKLKSSLLNKIDTINFNYIINNRKSFVGLSELTESIISGGYSDLRYKAFYNLDIGLQKCYTGLYIKSLLENQRKTVKGTLFPDFSLIDKNNNKHSIKTLFTSELTLLEFWYSNCRPCISQFPELDKLYLSFDRSAFEIVGISIDQRNDRTNWINTIKKYKIKWPQYWDIDGIQTFSIGINRFPQNILVDKNGKIIGKNISFNEIESIIKGNSKRFAQ